MVDRKTKRRPCPGGVSVGHYQITAGTLGCWVKKNDQWMLLSNNHVLANVNQAKIGDPIYQPGVYDGGTADDELGKLYEFVPIDVWKEALTILSPVSGDVWVIGEVREFRWQSNLDDEYLRIEISYNSGETWYTLIPQVPLKVGSYSWQVSGQTSKTVKIKLVPFNNPLDVTSGLFSIEPKSQSSGCRVAGAVATTFNVLARLLGRKTRLVAIVPNQGVATPMVEEKVNLVDCALAEPDRDEDVLACILEDDGSLVRVEGVVEPEVGLAVKKNGRTTGTTHGEISQVDVAVNVNMGNNRVALFVDQLIVEKQGMCAGGDSGSAVLTEDNEIVGLLYAGSDTTMVACKFSNVREALGIDIK